MKSWLDKNLINIISILLPFIIAAIIFLFRNTIEHEVYIQILRHELNDVKHDLKDYEKNNRDHQKEVFKYLNNKIEKNQ